jgi:hypothetical protein
MSECQEKRCALCHKSGPLCRSHVIPEFLFSTLYDTEHRFIEMTDVANGIVRKGQKGYWERLLCSSCESRLNQYEKHSRRLFVDPLPPHIANSRRIREHPRLDYSLFKLFCLSVLWRASVSSISIFDHVKLGPHEEKIRLMLLMNDAGDATTYPVQAMALHFEGDHFRDFLVEPTHARLDGQKFYRFVFMGFVIFIYVSGQTISPAQQRLAIAPNKPVQTFDHELREFTFLRNVWNKAIESQK